MGSEKRESARQGEAANTKKAKTEGDDTVKVVAPADEEVEEFFAILRRIQVALKYFQKRNSGGELTAAAWNPLFQREDFDGVEKTPEKQQGNQYAGLDLNSDPASEEGDASCSVLS